MEEAYGGPMVRTSTLRVSSLIAFILLAPVAAVALFDINLINRDGTVDPWIYTGYGQNFRLLHTVFGWTYYSARFPVMFLNSVFPGSIGAVAGYILLRYVILLACGVPLFLWSRQRFGTWIAAAAYLFLFCNPLLPRVILWDLTTFVSVPMALAGVCVWHLEVRGRAVARVLAGFLFCASIASHAFTGTAILVFFLVELFHRLAKRELRALILFDVLAPGLGAAICLALGILFYYAETGPFDPSIIFSLTIAAAKAGNTYATLHSANSFAWLASEYNVYVPYLLVLASMTGLGRAMLSGSSEARVVWFGLVYALAYAIYQFVFHAFVLEIYTYFAHLTIVAYLLFPLCLAIVARRLAVSSAGFVVASAIAMLLLFPLLNRFAPTSIDAIEAAMRGSVAAAVVSGVMGVMCSTLVRLRLQTVSALASAVALVGLVQLFCFVSYGHRIIFAASVQHQRHELGLYRAAIEMVQTFGAFAKPDAKVILWFPNDESSLMWIAAAVLEYTLQPQYEPHAGTPNIGAFERARLRIPGLRYILMLSNSEAVLENGVGALQKEGIAVRHVLRREVGDDAFRTRLEMLEISDVPRVASGNRAR
jgi:hypothetical protein